MMRIRFSNSLRVGLIFSLFLITAGPSIASAQTKELKLGFIDIDKVLESWSDFKAVSDTLEKAYEEKKNVLNQKNQSIQKEIDDFVAKKALLPADTIQQREKELQLQMDGFKNQLLKESKDFEQRKAEELKPLTEKLKSIVIEVSKEQGYAFVFRKNFLYYADPSYDITEIVLARINKK